jgi:hypothetical protein
MSIFNAEALAILEAIKATRISGTAKKIILTNHSVANLKDFFAEKRANLKIMWIPAHVCIGGNERAECRHSSLGRTRTRSSNRTQSRPTGLLPLGERRIQKKTPKRLEQLWKHYGGN